MKASIESKLDILVDRYEEIGLLLSDPSVIGNQEKYPSDFFVSTCFCLGGNPNFSLLLASPIILNLFMYQY